MTSLITDTYKAIELFNEDCILGMARYPDKWFDLALVDPPYGIGETGERSARPHKTKKCPKPLGAIRKYEIKEWDNNIPDEVYFKQLKRISKNQIIWGGNYFVENLTNSSGWIFWDKLNGDNDFADGELAWTSFDKATRKFTLLWNGFQRGEITDRIHPTQKPVKLYEWLLKNYAKQGDKILDTHGGSMSSAIACYNLDFDLTLFEIDKDYFEAGKNRLEEHKRQQRLFDLEKKLS